MVEGLVGGLLVLLVHLVVGPGGGTRRFLPRVLGERQNLAEPHPGGLAPVRIPTAQEQVDASDVQQRVRVERLDRGGPLVGVPGRLSRAQSIPSGPPASASRRSAPPRALTAS